MRRADKMRATTLLVLAVLGIGCAEPAPENSPSGDNPMFRERLLERIGDIHDFSRPRPLVTLEEFFEGNNDPASIGYNLPEQPAPADFYTLLRNLRDRDDVYDIRIEVKDMEDPDGWPSTDLIWFITSAEARQVRSWFSDRLAPDDVIEGFENSEAEAYDLPVGARAIGAWYD